MLHFQRWWRSARENLSVFLLFCLSIILSVASGWTTFKGIAKFSTGSEMPVGQMDFDVVLLTALITIGIQGVMLVTAIEIGKTIANSKRGSDGFFKSLSRPWLTFFRNLSLWVMFLATMAMSTFFSFDGLFTEKLYPEEARRARGAEWARTYVAALGPHLRAEVVARQAVAHDIFLKSAPFVSLKKMD